MSGSKTARLRSEKQGCDNAGRNSQSRTTSLSVKERDPLCYFQHDRLERFALQSNVGSPRGIAPSADDAFYLTSRRDKILQRNKNHRCKIGRSPVGEQKNPTCLDRQIGFIKSKSLLVMGMSNCGQTFPFANYVLLFRCQGASGCILPSTGKISTAKYDPFDNNWVCSKL